MSLQVLLVDDEAYIIDGIRDFLDDETDFAVETAYSGESALQKIDSFCPDICLVDMRLPGINGNEFILEAHKKYPDCIFLVHSGSIGYTPPLELEKIGVTKENVIVKPVLDLSIFLTKIFYFLGKKSV